MYQLLFWGAVLYCMSFHQSYEASECRKKSYSVLQLPNISRNPHVFYLYHEKSLPLNKLPAN